jgi:SAM-dependent methyltransferase
VLARWSSWGALDKVFKDGEAVYAAERAELRTLLTETEYDAASRTTINAHYTDLSLVAPMWAALRAMGFTGGGVLEPGCGSGNFIAAAPADAAMTGIELDPTTAAIAKLLYPDADIRTESFADTRIRPQTWDAVIANVPFANVAIYDRTYNPDRHHSLHDHFLIKSLDALRPGAVMVALTSTWTLDKVSQDSRARMYATADLIGAVRLPANSHQAAAGTGVVTDILILRRRLPDEPPGSNTWLDVVPALDLDGNPVVGISRGDQPGTQQNINAYFTDRPEQILGRLRSGGYNSINVAGDLETLPEQVPAALDRIVDHARATDRLAAATPVSDEPTKDLAPAPQTEANAHYTPASARTHARRHVPGQLTHLGATVTPGRTPRSRPTITHTFAEVDLDGDQVTYRCPPKQADELAALLRLRDLRLGDR